MEIGAVFMHGALAPRTSTPDEDTPYARLARLERSRHLHLPAELLLPGDVVRVEGWTLTVEDSHRRDGMVLLQFLGLDYDLIVREDRRIETVSRAEQMRDEGSRRFVQRVWTP